MRFASTSWTNSLALKVMLAYVAGATLTTAIIVVVVIVLTAYQGDMLAMAEVADTTTEIGKDLLFDRNGVPVAVDVTDFEWVFDSLNQETAYRVLDESGKVVLTLLGSEVIWPEMEEAGRVPTGSFQFMQRGVQMQGATAAVEHEGRTWYVQFSPVRGSFN